MANFGPAVLLFSVLWGLFCFGSSISITSYSFPYSQESLECADSGTRNACGFIGIDQAGCLAQNCCWSVADPPSPYCFTSSTDPPSKGSYLVHFNLSGGLSLCTQCGAAGAYYCTNAPLWTGLFNFTDRTPVGSVVVGYQFSTQGSYGCNGGQSSFQGIINAVQVLATIFAESSSDLCQCNTCDGILSSPQVGPLPYGDSAINLRETNTFHLNSISDAACLASITLEVFYAPPPLALPVVTVSGSFTAQPHGSCGFPSSFLQDGVIFNFNDPIPSGNILLTLTVEYFFVFADKSNYTLTTSLQSIPVGSNLMAYTECSSIFLSSSKIYQDGWPSYIYGGTNSLSVASSVSTTELELSFVTLSLVYVPN